MNVAIVTPLPPQQTGIADYTSDLILGLQCKDIHIDLFSNAPINSFHQLKVYNITEINTDILKKYDLIVYQMGNNTEFHLYMIELMKKYHGIVHLHDMVLHHIFAGVTYAKGNTQDYFEAIERWYGTEILDAVKEMIAQDNNTWKNMPWEKEIVTEIPLFEEFIQHTNTCIVHSEFVANRIKKVFPNKDVYTVPQLYKMAPVKHKKDSKTIKFGVFGGVDPQKRVDTVIEAFGEIFKINKNVEFSIVVVGGVNDRCDFIKELPAKLNLQDNVKITGRVDENTFMDYFYDIDVLIALRFPTMGETSAVVMRALQLGIPSIVNDIGWYSELPEHVIKIPIENMKPHLIMELMSILSDKNKLTALKKQAKDYSENNLNFEKYITLYLAILKKEYRHKLNQYQYSKLSELFEEMQLQDTVLSHITLNKVIDIF